MNKFNLKGVTKETWQRTVFLFISLVNLVINQIGLIPLDVTQEQVYTAVSVVYAIVMTLITFWKNNSFTHAAQDGDKVMESEREEIEEEDLDIEVE